MQTAKTQAPVGCAALPNVIHLDPGSPRRAEAENFISRVFARRYAARITSFAPRLLLLEEDGRNVAAAGWRGAESGPLFLERYLQAPIESIMRAVSGQPLERRHIVEVGNLAADKPGGGVRLILQLAPHLEEAGYEWVVFTATQELIGIFARLSLPLLALAQADPARLGRDALDWGSYYASRPVVVAGRIRLALDRRASTP